MLTQAASPSALSLPDNQGQAPLAVVAESHALWEQETAAGVVTTLLDVRADPLLSDTRNCTALCFVRSVDVASEIIRFIPIAEPKHLTVLQKAQNNQKKLLAEMDTE